MQCNTPVVVEIRSSSGLCLRWERVGSAGGCGGIMIVGGADSLITCLSWNGGHHGRPQVTADCVSKPPFHQEVEYPKEVILITKREREKEKKKKNFFFYNFFFFFFLKI